MTDRVTDVAHSVEDRYIVVQPQAVVSGFDRWPLLRLGSLEDMIDRSHAATCRELIAGDIELDPDGDCFNDDVLEHYDPETRRHGE